MHVQAQPRLWNSAAARSNFKFDLDLATWDKAVVWLSFDFDSRRWEKQTDDRLSAEQDAAAKGHGVVDCACSFQRCRNRLQSPSGSAVYDKFNIEYSQIELDINRLIASWLIYTCSITWLHDDFPIQNEVNSTVSPLSERMCHPFYPVNSEMFKKMARFISYTALRGALAVSWLFTGQQSVKLAPCELAVPGLVSTQVLTGLLCVPIGTSLRK